MFSCLVKEKKQKPGDDELKILRNTKNIISNSLHK